MGIALDDLRFDHPKVFYSGVFILGVGLFMAVFFLLPQSQFFEATGVSSAQRRALALKNSAYWYSRSIIHASTEELHFDTRFGHVIDYRDGLRASIPDGEEFDEVKFLFADVVVTSELEVNQIVQAVRLKDAKFEVYGDNKVVVWIEGKPLNISLIEAGAARPDPDPPTNIVDVAFASYYWNKFKGDGL